MPADSEFVVHDRRRPAWEWSAELSAAEHDELTRLRTERKELQIRLEELHIAAQDAHDRELELRAVVRRLATGPWPRRILVARRLRRQPSGSSERA